MSPVSGESPAVAETNTRGAPKLNIEPVTLTGEATPGEKMVCLVVSPGLSMRLGLAVTVVMLSACGALSPPTPKIDGGTTQGGRDGGLQTLPDGGQAHAADAASLADAGEEALDAGPQFRWSQYSFEATPPIPLVYRVVGVAQRQSGELWVALGDGLIYRALPGQFVLKKVGQFSTSTASDVVGLFTTASEVFVVREDRVLSCLSPCTQLADFTPVFTFTSTSEGVSGCGSGQQAFVISNLGGTTALHLKEGAGPFQTITSLPIRFGVSCTIFGGDVFVVGDTAIAIRSASGAINSEAILAPDHLVSWRSVAVTPQKAVVVGFGQGGEVAGRFGSSWSMYEPQPFSTGFSTVLALGDDSFLLAGAPTSANQGSPLYESRGLGFAPLKTTLPSVSFDRGLALGANEVVLGGWLNAFGSYFIVRGTRQ